jgi:hypothetical protein
MRRDMLPTLQPISAREPNNWCTQIADSEGREARKRAPFQIRICCRRSQHLRCYADQPIPWSNCSYAVDRTAEWTSGRR